MKKFRINDEKATNNPERHKIYPRKSVTQSTFSTDECALSIQVHHFTFLLIQLNCSVGRLPYLSENDPSDAIHERLSNKQKSPSSLQGELTLEMWKLHWMKCNRLDWICVVVFAWMGCLMCGSWKNLWKQCSANFPVCIFHYIRTKKIRSIPWSNSLFWKD